MTEFIVTEKAMRSFEFVGETDAKPYLLED